MSGMIKRAPRRKVMIPARMRAGGGQVAICIRDMSTRAMLVETASPPPVGTYVEIIGTHAITGRVLWVRDSRFGVGTREKLDVVAGGAGKAPTLVTQQRATSAAGAADAPRPIDLEHRADRSRGLSRMIEHGAIVLGAAVAALVIAGVSYRTVSNSLARVSASLVKGG